MSLTYGFNLDTTGTTYTAAQFAEAFGHLTGDTVTSFGSGFEITLGSLMSFTVGLGYVYAGGYWYKSKYAQTFTLENGYTSAARYDALAAVVDLDSREVTLQVLTDIDPDSPTQNDEYYQTYLYVFNVAAGMMQLSSSCITDKRVTLSALSDVGTAVTDAYAYATGGFTDAVDEWQETIDSQINAATELAETTNDDVDAVTGLAIGCLREAYSRPTPNTSWLACNGDGIDSSYSALIEALGSNATPELYSDDKRLTVWIYAGPPDS